MKRKHVFLSSAMALVLLLTSSTAAFASKVADVSQETTPYVQAYLKDLAEKNQVQSDSKNTTITETITSLNGYYHDDVALSEAIKEVVPADFDLRLIYSVEKNDKITAMHLLEEVYEQIKDTNCLRGIKDYFRRYAPYSGDTRAIAFYQCLFPRAQQNG